MVKDIDKFKVNCQRYLTFLKNAYVYTLSKIMQIAKKVFSYWNNGLDQ